MIALIAWSLMIAPSLQEFVEHSDIHSCTTDDSVYTILTFKLCFIVFLLNEYVNDNGDDDDDSYIGVRCFFGILLNHFLVKFWYLKRQ